MNIDTNIDTLSMFNQFVFHKNLVWTLCPIKNDDINIDVYIDTPSMCKDLFLSKQPAWTLCPCVNREAGHLLGQPVQSPETQRTIRRTL